MTQEVRFILKLVAKRLARISAFAAAAGIMFMGAGNVLGIAAAQSAAFGAAGAVLGLFAVLLFTYASKGNVPDSDFDTAINSAIQQVQSKTEKSD